MLHSASDRSLAAIRWSLLVSLALFEGCSGTSRNATAQMRGDRFDPVRTLIVESLNQSNVASLSIAAAQDGKIVWEESFGWADKDAKVKATPDSVYPLASLSKSLTATGLMVLAERGQVNLDKPANDYLGEAKLVSFVGNADEATVRRLLLHTAGLPMHAHLFPAVGGGPPASPEESVRRYGIIVDEPGREYYYSNFGYGVIERIIARVARRGYGDFMTSDVFEPLGMRRTSVLAATVPRDAVVQCYDASERPVPQRDSDHRGASLIYSSAHDLIRYGMFHLGNRVTGQKPILRDASLKRMQAPSEVRVPDESAVDVRAAMGWAVVDLAGQRFLIASGAMPGTRSRLALIPAKNVAVAILANGEFKDDRTPWHIEWKTFSAMLPAFPEIPKFAPPAEEPFSPTPELLGEWRGTVRTPSRNLPARLIISSGRDVTLEIDGRPGKPIPIRTALPSLAFRNGVLTGPFFGRIDTADAARSPHVLFLRVRLRGQRLDGFVAAAAMNQTFVLPHWIELKKEEQR